MSSKEKHEHEMGQEIHDEMRTIAFRLREIQRLMAMRVMQENRRMENNGLEKVDDNEFIRTLDDD